MSIQVQRRRGTLAENAAFTGAAGEFTYITDSKRMAVHDGSTAGGIQIPNNRDITADYYGYATATGTDTIALTVLSQITAYAAGQQFTFKAAATNTASATLNVNTLGAKTLKKKNPIAGTIDNLEAGDIISGGIYTARYDGTYMQITAIDGGSPSGWDFLSTQTASASAALDFTSLITSDYTSYLFDIKDIRPATDNVNFWMRTSTDNGSTYDATAAHYTGRALYGFIGDGAVTINETSSTALVLAGGNPTAGKGIGNAAAEGIGGFMILNNPLGTVQYKRVSGELMWQTNANVFAQSEFHGCRAAVADVTAARFMMSTGNITSGSVNMYGMKAS